MKEKNKDLWVICPNCKYYNQKELVDRFGTCKLCNKVLNEKAKYKYEMYCRLRLWSRKEKRFL